MAFKLPLWLKSLWVPPVDPDLGQLDTVAYDGVPWRAPLPSDDVLAIGDLHGDVVALATLLHQARVVDEAGEWIGGRQQVVLLGDLMGGGDDSRLLLDFILRLEAAAPRTGGALHAVLGNHDLLALQGELGAFTRKEKRLFKKFPIDGESLESAAEAFQGNNRYAQFFRRANVLLQIGDTVFVHAGLGVWAEQVDFGRVNATVRAWIRYWQLGGEKPPKTTRWTVGKADMARGSKWEAGPAWNRSYKVKTNRQGEPRHRPLGEALSAEALQKILARVGAKRVVIGHAPLDSGEILLHHPEYGERVVMADTRLSDSGGRLAAVRIEGTTVTELRTDSRKPGKRIREAEWERLKETAAEEGRSWSERIKNWFRRNAK